MNSDTIVLVENLSKKFAQSLKRNMLYGSIDLTKNLFGIPSDFSKLRKGEFWALQNISFEIKRGEKIGFLGENGSGKSTLLRLINGIFPPDIGRITTRGSIGALIAVGAGFHPHMTGRENIYLNGTILGMSRGELEKKVAEIIEFAEIGSFIDSPVSTYSSGMRVRLGFSIAIHIEPDIMLVDEVLSVGDLAFNLKGRNKLSEYRNNGGTFILVSHNMQMIRNTCDRVIWLDHGKVIEDGEVNEVCDKYEDFSISKTFSEQDLDINKKIIKISNKLKISDVEILDQKKEPITKLMSGEQLIVKFNYDVIETIKKPIFTFTLTDSDANIIFESYSNFANNDIKDELKGSGTIEMSIDHLNVTPNKYSITLTFSELEQMNKLEWHDKAYTLNVLNNPNLKFHQGLVYFNAKWKQN